ncbi:unnamed protein product [Gongylonema pulchrum]|uniref:DUF5405 domain-containing protein n=1 Tax=Gongylonema pulchrum TaxID=637853 RepID=A0A183D4H1_9BILA|nr:unnamed protein product [Gongylonema pulchrum]
MLLKKWAGDKIMRGVVENDAGVWLHPAWVNITSSGQLLLGNSYWNPHLQKQACNRTYEVEQLKSLICARIDLTNAATYAITHTRVPSFRNGICLNAEKLIEKLLE